MNRNLFIGLVVVLILCLLGYFAWTERQNSATTNATTTTATSSGTSIIISPNSGATTTSGYTVTLVSTSSAPIAPNDKAPLSYPSGISADAQAAYQSQYEIVEATLKSKPNDYHAWIELGILRKETGDYQGAAADWSYVTKIYPSDPTAFADLGDLYANFLKQPSKGIPYYKDAIKLDPTKEETFYDNLAQIYLAEGDKADAKATLQQGITAQVIGYQNLQNELNSLQ